MTAPEEEPLASSQFQGEPDKDPVFALAGDPCSTAIFAGKASGLYFSPDGGSTWQPALESLGLVGPVPIVSVAISPHFLHDRTILAGAPGGALRSTDGGATWQILPFPPPSPYFTTLVFSPNFLEDGVLFGGTAEDGFFRLTNRGDSWTRWNFGLLDLEILCMAVSPAFAEDETLYAGTSSGLFQSTNGGRAWKEVAIPCGHVAVLSLATGASAGERLPLLVGTEEHGLFFSPDGGDNWQPAAQDPLIGAVNMLFAAGAEECLDLAVLLDGEVRIAFNGELSWRRVRLPAGPGIVSAILPPVGLGPDLPLLVGLESGEVQRLEPLTRYLE